MESLPGGGPKFCRSAKSAIQSRHSDRRIAASADDLNTTRRMCDRECKAGVEADFWEDWVRGQQTAKMICWVDMTPC